MVRVLQVLTRMNRSGAETMIMNYYRNIDRTKVQFDFLVHRDDKGDYDDEILAMGGKIYRIQPINPLKIISYKEQLKYFLQNHDYKIIHSHLNAFSKYVLQVAQDVNIPVRIAHGHMSLNTLFNKNISIKENSKNLIKNYIKKDIQNVATDMFACEKNAAKWLFGKKNVSKVEIINNAIDVDKFKFEINWSTMIKQELNLIDKFIIGHIGNFSPPKNYNFIIDVFYELKKIKSESVLLLVGDGILFSKIKEKVQKLGIESAVIFTGKQGNIPYYLQAMDVFLFPSLYEGLPVTLIEAQAAGLKIIASDKIDKKVVISELITMLSLKRTSKEWAKTIVRKSKNFVRQDVSEIIVKHGYDIKHNALQLQNFYLKSIKDYV